MAVPFSAANFSQFCELKIMRMRGAASRAAQRMLSEGDEMISISCHIFISPNDLKSGGRLVTLLAPGKEIDAITMIEMQSINRIWECL